jgi:hypothetical protein
VRVVDGSAVSRLYGGGRGGRGRGGGRGKGGRGRRGGGRDDEFRGDRWPPAAPPPRVTLRTPPDCRARDSLPSRLVAGEILSAIASHQVLVLTGETGCGKTTQVPQLLLEQALGSDPALPCRIVCTQPRRIAAISVAHRVAHETGTELGGAVGYGVRLESKRSPDTQVLYCTTGLFLKMLVGNPTLEGMTHIVLDEVHERDRYTDFLLIMLRQMLPSRPDLRLVLMSATLEVGTFTSYFPGAGQIHVTGRTFPVERMFLGEALRAVGFTGNPAAHGGGGGGGGGRGASRGGGEDSRSGRAAAAGVAATPAVATTAPSQSGFDARQLEQRLDRAWHASKDAAAAAINEILTASGLSQPSPRQSVVFRSLTHCSHTRTQCSRSDAIFFAFARHHVGAPHFPPLSLSFSAHRTQSRHRHTPIERLFVCLFRCVLLTTFLSFFLSFRVHTIS